MTAPQLYPYGCKHLSAKEVAALHPHPVSADWVKKHLNKGTPVMEILAKPLMTKSQSARMGRKASRWDKGYF